MDMLGPDYIYELETVTERRMTKLRMTEGKK
jgi:hypothetical protein